MKYFVTGVSGQLGYDLMNELTKRGFEVLGSDIHPSSPYFTNYVQLDITDLESVLKVIKEYHPDVIINPAAWTAVDNAEDEDKKALCMKINVEGPRNIALAAKEVGAKMIQISTDYVFSGEGNSPWEPDCKEFKPLGIYGLSKLGGEKEVSSILEKYFIVRIAWAFGKNGNNFVKTMLTLADKGYKDLRVVDDQIGTPTYMYDLARLLVDMSLTEKYGFYHATNEGGYISWADFAIEIFKQAKRDVIVHRVTTEEYGLSKAKRPKNSRLDKSKLKKNGFIPLPTWQDALTRYLKDYK